MPSIAAFVKLRAKDQTSRVFDKMAKRAEKMERRTKRSFKGMSKSALGFKSVMAGVVGANVLQRGGQLLAQGIGTATREFVDFDQALTVASAKFPEKIKRGTKAFGELQDAARKVGGETEFTAKQAAEGLALFAAAGESAENSMAGLIKITDLATATSSDFASATETALAALGQFGLEANSGAEFAANLERVNRALVFTVNTSRVTLEDLTETLKFVGPVANLAGAELEEVTSIIGAMAKANIKGSLAGTSLKNMYLRLLDVTPKMGKQLKKLGVNLDDGQGGMTKMTDIIAQMEKGLKKLTPKQQGTSLAIIFGKRAVAGASKVIGVGSKAIRKYTKDMENAGNVSKETADAIRDGLGAQMKVLESSAIELGFEFIDAFADKGEGSILAATEAIRNFDVKPVVEEMKKIFAIISRVVSVLWANKGLIMAFAAVLTGIKVAQTAMMAFNAIAAANPIFAIISGLLIAKGLMDDFIAQERDQKLAKRRGAFASSIAKQDTEIKGLASEIKQAPDDDLEKQLQLHIAIGRKIRSQSMTKALIKEDVTEERRQSDLIFERMKKIRALQEQMKFFPFGAGPQNFMGGGANLPELDFGQTQAPNASEVAAKNFLNQNNVDVTVNNALPGTTVDAKGKGAPRVNSNLAGANP